MAVNRVRLIVRSCKQYCPKGQGITTCHRSQEARTADGCQWRASLMHPLDEPEGLERLVPADVPAAFGISGIGRG